MLLSLVPETQGRALAGVSATSSGQAAPAATIAAPPATSCRTAASRPHGAIHSQASASPGTTISAARHLGLEAEPHAQARECDPARAAVLEPAQHTPQRADRAQDEQRVRVV